MRQLLGFSVIIIVIWKAYDSAVLLMNSFPDIPWWVYIIYVVIIVYFIKYIFNKYVDSTQCESCKNLIIRKASPKKDANIEIEYLSVTYKHANEDGSRDKRYKNNPVHKIWNDKVTCNKCTHVTITKRNSNDGFGWAFFFLTIIIISVVYFVFFSAEKEDLKFDHEIINGIERSVGIDLNVREKPMNSAEILSVLKSQTKVIASQELIHGWVLVADKDTNEIGYIYEGYLE